MSFLQDLMGGGQKRQEFEDFTNRYDQGHPAEGYDDDEVVNRYQQVSGQMSPQDYQEAAHQSFSRMSPQERMQLGQHMQQQARQQGVQDPAWDEDDNQYQDPRYLSQVAGRMEGQQPGMLGQLFGGGGGGAQGGMSGVSGSMGGVTSGAGSMLSNPLAKAALAGVAAFGAKKMMGRM